MVCNPCCCSLQSGTKAVAILQILGGAILMLISGISLFMAGKAALILAISLLIAGLASLFLGVILIKGANERDLKKCRIWLGVQLVLFVLGILITIAEIVTLESNNDEHTTPYKSSTLVSHFIRLAVQTVLQIYCMIVVHAFTKELQEGISGASPFHNV